MATYYVGTGGNDGNAGTSWAARFLTLNAIDGAFLSAGDTVYVGPGSYIVNGAGSEVALTTNGSSGNEITIIGDYTGENTDGVGGLVRVTRSTDDQTPAGSVCFDLQGDFTTVRGFHFDGANSAGYVYINSATDCIIEKCSFGEGGASNGIQAAGTTDSIIRNCMFFSFKASVNAILFFDALGASDTGNLVENCLAFGSAGTVLSVYGTGGVTFRNCTVIGGEYGIRTQQLPAAQTITVNNCILSGQKYGLHAETSGEITEDYNDITGFSTAARTNVSAGANSRSSMAQFDPRWWHELVSGDGTVLSPFDLASYSAQVELNSGTGAPAADARGNAVGTYREWGALEYTDDLKLDTRERRPRIMRFK